jgi:predicted RNA-binding protein with PIN domain
MKALVVDGYNAIYKIPRLRAMLDRSLSEAREALTRIGLDYKRKTGGIAEVVVVFDGQDAHRGPGTGAHSPHQVFSGTGGGDRKIIETVRRLSCRYHVIVASDDNFVRNNSRVYNATPVTIAEFLAAAEKGRKRNDAPPDEKAISPDDMRSITDYVKERLKR